MSEQLALAIGEGQMSLWGALAFGLLVAIILVGVAVSLLALAQWLFRSDNDE